MKRQVCTWYTKPTTKTTLITLTLYIYYIRATTTNKKYEVINYTGPPHATILCHNSTFLQKAKMDFFFNKNKREVKVLFSFFATRKEEEAEIRKEEEDFPL